MIDENKLSEAREYVPSLMHWLKVYGNPAHPEFENADASLMISSNFWQEMLSRSDKALETLLTLIQKHGADKLQGLMDGEAWIAPNEPTKKMLKSDELNHGYCYDEHGWMQIGHDMKREIWRAMRTTKAKT